MRQQSNQQPRAGCGIQSTRAASVLAGCMFHTGAVPKPVRIDVMMGTPSLTHTLKLACSPGQRQIKVIGMDSTACSAPSKAPEGHGGDPGRIRGLLPVPVSHWQASLRQGMGWGKVGRWGRCTQVSQAASAEQPAACMLPRARAPRPSPLLPCVHRRRRLASQAPHQDCSEPCSLLSPRMSAALYCRCNSQ